MPGHVVIGSGTDVRAGVDTLRQPAGQQQRGGRAIAGEDRKQ